MRDDGYDGGRSAVAAMGLRGTGWAMWVSNDDREGNLVLFLAMVPPLPPRKAATATAGGIYLKW